MAKECSDVNRRLAQLIAEKRKEQYGKVINHVRTRLRFAMLRATLCAVRGYRGRISGTSKDLSTVDFNLIPEAEHYDV